MWLRVACGAGFIQLVLPVFHIGYFKQTMVLLHCICKSCSRVRIRPRHDGVVGEMSGSSSVVWSGQAPAWSAADADADA